MPLRYFMITILSTWGLYISVFWIVPWTMEESRVKTKLIKVLITHVIGGIGIAIYYGAFQILKELIK